MNDDRRALFGPFALNTRRGCLTRGDEDVHLRPQAYEVLRYLVENDGRLVGKDELIAQVWQGRAVTDGSLGKCIEEIRDALGPSARTYVRNVRGRGYLFDSQAGEPCGETAEDAAPSEEPDVLRIAVQETAAFPGLARPRVAALAVGLAAAVIVVAVLLVVKPPLPAQSSTVVRPETVPVRSLAVLPFRPTEPGGGERPLELGMADAIIVRLGILSGITVRPLGAVRQYTNPAQDSREVGRALDVDAVLEGSIHRWDSRVRVTARLLQVRDGRELWTNHFDGRFGEIFAVQEAIAGQVARALAVELTNEQLRHLTKRYTDNIAAYQYYLQGRQHLLALTRQDLFAALHVFERAVAEDRNYALAYAGLADVYTQLVPRGLIGAAEGRAQAQVMARKALSLDGGLPEAHAAIGQVLVYAAPYDFESGDQALRRAIQLSPNLAIAHHFLGVSLVEQGRLDAALVEWEIARRLDPLSPRIARMLAYTYLLKGDHRRALELVRQARDLGPVFSIFPEIEIYIEAGATEEADDEIRRAAPERGEEPVLLYSSAILSATHGRRLDALRVATMLEESSPPHAVPAHLIAGIHAVVGDEAAATAWLERGVEAGSIPLFYKDSAIWKSLRGATRFTSLLRRMNVPDSL